MRISSFIDNDSTSISLESQLERLSIEANLFNNVIDTFRNIVPNLLNKLTDISLTINPDTIENEIVKNISNDFAKLSKKIEHVNFGTYNKTLVSIPEGFKGYLLDYISTLEALSSDVYIKGNSILNDYNTIISSFINNKEEKIALKDNTQLYKQTAKDREKISNILKDYFPTSSSTSKAYLETVVARFNDLDKLVEKVSSFNREHNKQNMKQFKMNIDKTTSLLNIIIDESNNSISNISGNAAKNIAEGAYEIAKFIELVSIYRFKSEQAIVTIGSLIKVLNEKIK